MAKPDVELVVFHPQALQERWDASTKVQNALRAEADAAEKRARDLEAESGIKSEGQRAALRRVGETIRYSPTLLPWMRAYAEWLTLGTSERPTWVHKTTKARSLSRAPVSRQQLMLLEARPDFITYVRALESGPLERARQQFQAAFPEYVDAHKEALDAARDAKDYAAVARIAEPVLDRVMPKKSEGGAAPSVTVVLAPEQVKAIATYEAPEMLVDAIVESPSE